MAERLVAQIRRTIRARHYSRRTGQAYVRWVRRFLNFHDPRHPADLGSAEVTGCTEQTAPGIQGVEDEAFLVNPQCYAGYFGSYRIENDSTVVHLPEGGTIPSYIGREQPRRLEVRGDSLRIERSASVYRLLLRVR